MKKIKFIAFVIVLLALALCYSGCDKEHITNKNITALKIKVVDVGGNPVQKAKITVVENNISFFTDNNGLSPTIEIQISKTALNVNQNWSTVTIVVSHDSFASTILFNCVVYDNQIRDDLTIRLFKLEQSQLPYAAIVEVPPDEFIRNLLDDKNDTSQKK